MLRLLHVLGPTLYEPAGEYSYTHSSPACRSDVFPLLSGHGHGFVHQTAPVSDPMAEDEGPGASPQFKVEHSGGVDVLNIVTHHEAAAL